MTNMITDTSRLPAVECEPWCRVGNGHTHEWHPDDQWCSSEQQRVHLTRHGLVKMSDGSHMRDWMALQLYREREGRPFVHLGHSDEIGVELTPAEALELARILTDLAETAEHTTFT